MSAKPTRRNILKSTLVAAAAAGVPIAMAKEVTVHELEEGLSKPLTPSNLTLAEKALADVKKASIARRSHKLPENSEPSLMFQVRPGATTQW